MDNNVFNLAGNDARLFEFIERDPSTNIQLRIKRAVNWVGRALRSPEIAEGFLWLAIALETLLIAQDGFISRSITAQLAEFAAFLTASDVETRKQVNKSVKELYQTRSAIVHSSATKIQGEDFDRLLVIVRRTLQAGEKKNEKLD